ncbi:hypothetical protein [Liquorilactobacillus sp.]|uniref:hypothetical protein n=1 Tax=Liquorilactobacillus sp. TaxID=2767923 RepID=UPI0039E9D09D
MLKQLKNNYTWFYLQSFFIILSILSVYIFSHRGIIYNADDLKFHVDRINGLYQAIRNNNSIFMMPSFKTFKNVGDMVQSFYPMITLLPFAILRFIFANPVLVLYIGLTFYTYLGFLIAYQMMLKFSGNLIQSASFAIIYNMSIYHLTDLFIRFDIGEWLALMFFPLAIYGFYNIFFEDGKNYYWAVVGLSLVTYSHILSAVFLLVTVILMFIIAIMKQQVNKETVVTSLKVIVLFVMQILFIVYPLAVLTLKNRIHFPTKYNLMVSPGGELSSLGTFITNSANNHLNRSLGVIFLVIFVWEIFKWKKMPKVYKYSFSIMNITAILTTSLFPWYLLQQTSIAVIQFPWRLLGISGFFMAVVGAWLVKDVVEEYAKSKRFSKIYVIGILTLLTLPSLSAEFYTFYQKSQKDELITTAYQQESSKNYSITSKAFAKYFGELRNSSSNTDYYTEKAFTHKESIQKRVILFEDGTQNNLVQTEFKNNELSFSLNSEKKQLVDIPIIFYDGVKYTLTINNSKEKITSSKRGTMQFVLKKGHNKIVLKKENNGTESLLVMLTLVAWIVLGFRIVAGFKLVKRGRMK